ncbi:hypothetical protein [Mesorhizobium opportunistum]|uniref:Uncharacterized protein n=1 Tax=Mesorhizobium opportunistum (strain LMG 24607 / HAMBI 3007 / WSM2075) TaxID=536019 RepID=F7YCA3_MESOW|nr:hypothetical protein [Mesorhizobium opportunistum]AEH86636.1 hypothetical protein Mesop_2158 [Mesorhizobium opportunistum WSM2075]
MAETEEDYRFNRRLERLELITAILALNPGFEPDRSALKRLKKALRWDRSHPLDDQNMYELARAIVNGKSRVTEDIGYEGDGPFNTYRFYGQMSYIERQSKRLEVQITQLQRAQRQADIEIHSWLTIQSMGLDTKAVPLTRFIPLKVYLSDTTDTKVDEVAAALSDLVEAVDFEIADEFPGIRGSWFQKWFAKTKEVATSDAVTQRLAKVEHALEIKGLALPQAEADDKLASAVERLSKSTESVPHAAMQVGSILFVKVTVRGVPSMQVRTLSATEMIQLERNPGLLASPQDILKRLSDLCSDEASSDEKKADLAKPSVPPIHDNMDSIKKYITKANGKLASKGPSVLSVEQLRILEDLLAKEGIKNSKQDSPPPLLGAPKSPKNPRG